MTTQKEKPVAIMVNDEPTQLNILARPPGKGGMEVRAFTGVEVALAAMDPANPPDLVVTDLNMPGIDGWRFCRLLHSPEYLKFNQFPIIVISATFSGEQPERITADLGAEAIPAPLICL